MVPLTTAMELLLQTVPRLPVEPLPLEQCCGLTLASDVVSEIDSPPFDKALMDGFAVRSADVVDGTATLRVIEQVAAGQVPQQAIVAGTAIQIMTGAPLPAGADAVVRIEDTRSEQDTVTISGPPVKPESNLSRRGGALRVGETVLQAGQRLTASRIGALAELGWAQVPVRRRPRVSVLATGDELVPVGTRPGPGQIRNSNEAMLMAQIQTCGAEPIGLGIVPDVREALAAGIRRGLESDILVLSGGVSAGKFDLVPSELAAAGVREVFHKVNLKPGKPVWFGVHEPEPGRTGCLVFGLPGNPVGSMVCFELFVRTAVRVLMGVEAATPEELPATVTHEFRHRSDRPTFHPAECQTTATGWTVRLLPWQGSSDLRATVAANGMAVLTAGEQTYQPGDQVPIIRWD